MKDILKIMDALGLETKANEAMHSTQASYGDEFVPTELAENIINTARDESKVLAALNQANVLDMPTNPYEMPVEAGDPTFYNTTENTDLPGTANTNSKAGTAKMTLSASKFSATVFLSGELEEDARIAGGIRQYVENKMGLAFAELVDRMIINGDTETGSTGNVNKDNAAPTAGVDYLAFDGLVKKAFTDSLTFNAGTLDSGDFMNARKLLGGKKGANPEKLICIMNPETYYKTIQLAQVETAEKFSGATIENGVLKAIYGVPIVVNSDFLLAEADGKVNTTTGTLGRFLMVYVPHVYVGWRRRLKINVEYLPRVDQWAITAHTRFTMNNPEAGVASLAYNITI